MELRARDTTPPDMRPGRRRFACAPVMPGRAKSSLEPRARNRFNPGPALQEPPMPRPTLEFWFDFGSNYSYLAASRIEGLAAAAGVDVRWRPFLLGPIFASFGWSTSPFVLQKEKGDYVARDMVRLCARYGIPWTPPTTFPRNAVHPMRVAAAHEDAPWVPEYCRRFMAMNFAQDRDIASPELAAQVLRELGEDADGLVRSAQTDEGRARLRARGDEARRRGIFGAPMFFAGPEMFWGNDRLEDALAWAASGRA
jgi:2-hydroxychromene-2-carboxylate isomerase